MKIVVLTISLLLVSILHAKSIKSDKEYVKFQKFNSLVAKNLNFKNPKNYHDMRKALVSVADKARLKNLYLKKKTSKATFFPFMDHLYIKEGLMVTAVRIVQIKPLKIKVNGGVVRTIDHKNIHKSFESSLYKKSAWDWISFFSKAFAWGWGRSEAKAEDWVELYIHSANSVIYAGNSPLLETTDIDIIAKEAANFVNEFGITEINCDSDFSKGDSAYVNYIEIIRGDDGRTLLECDAMDDNCRLHPLDATKKIKNLGREIASMDHHIISSLLVEIKEKSGRQINPNHYDVECSDENCHLIRSSAGLRMVSDNQAEQIAKIDLASIGGRKKRKVTKQDLATFRKLKHDQALHFGSKDSLYAASANRGKAMYSMAACCYSDGCVDWVNGKGSVKMSSPDSTSK